MSVHPHAKLTPQEYLALERQSEYKSEYVDGELFAMAGASKRHNLIVTNTVRELSLQLKKQPCHVYSNDMRVRIPQTRVYTYPDIVVVCDKPEFEDQEEDTLLNPTVIIEVLSKSTAMYDRGGKFLHYRTLDSLHEYLLISQTVPLIEHYVRQPDSVFWLFSEANNLQEVVELPSVNCRLALAEVYDKIDLSQEPITNT